MDGYGGCIDQVIERGFQEGSNPPMGAVIDNDLYIDTGLIDQYGYMHYTGIFDIFNPITMVKTGEWEILLDGIPITDAGLPEVYEGSGMGTYADDYIFFPRCGSDAVLGSLLKVDRDTGEFVDSFISLYVIPGSPCGFIWNLKTFFLPTGNDTAIVTGSTTTTPDPLTHCIAKVNYTHQQTWCGGTGYEIPRASSVVELTDVSDAQGHVYGYELVDNILYIIGAGGVIVFNLDSWSKEKVIEFYNSDTSHHIYKQHLGHDYLYFYEGTPHQDWEFTIKRLDLESGEVITKTISKHQYYQVYWMYTHIID